MFRWVIIFVLGVFFFSGCGTKENENEGIPESLKDYQSAGAGTKTSSKNDAGDLDLEYIIRSLQKDIQTYDYIKYLRALREKDNIEIYEVAGEYRNKGYTDSALIAYNLIITDNASQNNIEAYQLLTKSLLESAIIYYNNFNYAKSMDLLLAMIEVAEANNLDEELSIGYRYMGNIFSIHNDFQRAIYFYRKSMVMATEIDNVEQLHLVLRNLVAASLFLNDLEAANNYYDSITLLPKSLPLYNYDIYMEKGLIEAQTGNLEGAIKDFKRTVDISLEDSLGIQPLASAYSYLASMYAQKEMTDSALYYLHINEKLARESEQMDLLTETVKTLALLYKEKGDLIKSQGYLEEYVELSDSVFNQKRFNEIKNSQFEHDIDKERMLVQKLNNDNIKKQTRLEMQVTMLWFFFLSFIVLIFFIFIIYKQKNKLGRAYSELFKKAKDNLREEEFYKNRIKDLVKQLKNNKTRTKESSDINESSHKKEEAIDKQEIGEVIDEENQNTLTDDQKNKIDMAIRDVMDNIDVICDPSFSLFTLASMVDSNTTYVSRVINDLYGKNFRNFLNEYRIREAMRRMANRKEYGNLTMRAISEDVGYKSQSSFISAFIKYTGMKPSLYQEMINKQDKS